jgi:hypothetical protein
VGVVVKEKNVIKVKATSLFADYRNFVLKLSKKDYRALQAGEEAVINRDVFSKYSHLFKEIKNGD